MTKFTFEKMINNRDLYYHAYRDTKYTAPSGTTYRGVSYTLCDPLTPEARADLLKKYNNIVLAGCKYRYAQEIKYDIIFISNTTIKIGD